MIWVNGHSISRDCHPFSAFLTRPSYGVNERLIGVVELRHLLPLFLNLMRGANGHSCSGQRARR